jgi:hypothetical protein
VCRFQASQLRAIELEVRFSPEDCNIPGIQEAHASIEGLDDAKRDLAIDLFNSAVVREPKK